jgi:hypothetical protein
MAERTLVSPGVFTREIDESFLGQGIGQIGAAIIGRAEKGPAFVPVRVSNFNEYAQFFGTLNEDYTLGYAAKAYLQNAGTLNVVRVLGPAGRTANGSSVTPGYTADGVWGITAGSGSVGAVLALIQITGSADLVVNDLTTDKLDIRISGTGGAGLDPQVAVTASFLTGSSDYIKNVLNTDPTQFSTKGYWVMAVFDYATKQLSVGNAKFHSASYGITNFAVGYNSASSPWIKSQVFGGGTEYDLFRVHTLGHGSAENGRFKVNVVNVKAAVAPTVSEYGSFDLELREFGSDKLVETYPGLSLDPASRNYIALRVGDQYFSYNQTLEKVEVNGLYPNVSKFIRVELTTGSLPASALPWGFKGFSKPALMVLSGTGASDTGVNASVTQGISALPYVKDLLDKVQQADYDEGLLWGVEYTLSGSVASRLRLFPSMTGSDADFSLANVSGSSVSTFRYNASNPTDSKKAPGDTSTHTVLEPKHAQFSLPLGGGFDGFDETKTNPLDNDVELAAVTQIGTQALRQAVDIVGDPDFIDINLLAIPGIHSDKVVEYAIDTVESRADALYIIDVSGSSVDTVTTEVKNRGFDSNYACVYYSDLFVKDPVNNKAVRLPASVAALGAMAFTDRVSFPWFAPAGMFRGGLNLDTIGFSVLRSVDRLKGEERNKLYENRVNPIASFPGEGLTIWGQKTLQLKPSALDRISVRRLLLKARKLVSAAAKVLVFEPNNPSTWTRFKQTVNPILADIQQKNGIERFKVIMDETTNTPDLIDRNIMAGKILLVPTRAAEFLSIDFVINNSGVTFEE